MHFLRCWLKRRTLRPPARLIRAVWCLCRDLRDRQPMLSRLWGYSAVLLVVALGMALSRVSWPAPMLPALPLSTPSPAVAEEGIAGLGDPSLETGPANPGVSAARGDAAAHVFGSAESPAAPLDRPYLGIVLYTVQLGDTVPSIAGRFGLDPTTVMWANPSVEAAPDLLRIGQQLIILPVDGIYHQVGGADTLVSIAEEYGVELAAIRSCVYNSVLSDGQAVEPGEFLLVPGGTRPYQPRLVTAYAGVPPQEARGTGQFQWPVVGEITQDYWHGHRAIDVGASEGTAVLASDEGLIRFAGWTDAGYEYLIVVDHAGGFATYYAHLSTIYVARGQEVRRGGVIGAVGNTGNSTGPHLHFEVRRHARQHNPRAYLP